MAWALADNWVIYSDVGLDSRSSSIQRNDTGTNYNNTAAFDYFSNSAGVNDAIYFAFIRRYWGIKVNVGTAFSATSVTFVWEYRSASSTWKTLRVDNHNVFKTTGSQTVNFTPPSDWYCQREKGWHIRCRISAVSGITEGGANATDKATFNMKELRGTGTITTLTSAVTSNDAGTYTILQPTTSATGLVPIQMSVLAIRDIAKVDVILASTTAGAGDTVVLTGVDLDGNAVTETIDVSGGNGTYTSTKTYADITLVDCNGFTDGTCQVNQKKWGAIEETMPKTYMINMHLCAGDGSTTTTITLLSENLIFARGAFHWVRKATLTFGALVGSGDSEDGYRGCLIREGTDNNGELGVGADVVRGYGTTGNTINYYGSMISLYTGGYSSGPMFRNMGANYTTLNFRHSIIRAYHQGGNVRRFYNSYGGAGLINFHNTLSNYDLQWINDVYTFSKTTFSDGFHAEIGSYGATLTDCTITGTCRIWFYTNNGYFNFIACNVTTSSFAVGWSGVGVGNEKLRLSTLFDMKLLDEAGNPIEDATIVFTDGAGATSSTTTDASGDISQQTLTAYSGSYTAYDSAITWVDKSAYTISIKKAGYEARDIQVTLDNTKKYRSTYYLKRATMQIDQEGGIQ